MTAYSPLRIASSEFGKLSVTIALESETFPIELVLGIPISFEDNIQLRNPLKTEPTAQVNQ